MANESKENYLEVWNAGCEQLVANLRVLGLDEIEISSPKKSIKCLSFSMDGLGALSVDIEFDAGNDSYKYGIYFGIREPKDDSEELVLGKIWEVYKAVMFPGKDIKREMVFHPDDDSCNSPRKWVLWIRLNDDDKLGDAAGRMWLLAHLCLIQQSNNGEIQNIGY